MSKSSLAEEVISSEENGEVQQPPFTEEQVGFLESLLQKTVSRVIKSARPAGSAIPRQSTQDSDSSPGPGERGIGGWGQAGGGER